MPQRIIPIIEDHILPMYLNEFNQTNFKIRHPRNSMWSQNDRTSMTHNIQVSNGKSIILQHPQSTVNHPGIVQKNS
jgi:hypothetical protein